jgi:PPOX class probable F420-dependent enzyme
MPVSFVKTAQEREEFLAGVHVGVVAVERPGRAPLATPVWYDYAPGGDVLIWTDRGTVKERLFREAGRFSICAQDETLPYRYVTAEGPVAEIERAPTEDEALQITARYMPAEDAARWVADNLGPDSLLVRMRPDRWLSADYGKA